MTKIASKLAAGLTILGLAAPAFAATTPSAGNAAAQVQTSQPKHHRTHRRVAQADQKKATEKKVQKKHKAKATAPKAETSPAPAAAPAK